MNRKYLYVALVFTAAVIFTPAVGADTRFAFVQYQAGSEAYAGPDTFRADVAEIVERAALSGADCVVFPEYINVFLATIPLADELESVDSLEAGFELIRRRYGDDVDLKEYFAIEYRQVRRLMDSVWGGVAAQYGIWIVAGTAFAADEDTGRLYNRLFVYDPRGEVAYTQNKVYLTPFEKDVVGIDAGLLEEAGLFRIGDCSCAFSICRDTFFDAWESKFLGADIWIDLKANGAEFDAQTEDLFLTALPERIANTGISLGATVCLTGEFLELFWEGRSSVIVASRETPGYRVLSEAATADGEEMLFHTVEAAGPTIDAAGPHR